MNFCCAAGQSAMKRLSLTVTWIDAVVMTHLKNRHGIDSPLWTVIDIDLPTSRRRSLSFAAWHAWDAAS